MSAKPESEKSDLRDAYPLGLMTAPEEEIVRIHSSSGTTGLPVIIPYTAKDVEVGVLPRSEKKTKRVIDERYE